MFSNGTKELSSNNSNNELYHTSKGLQIACCWGWQASHSTHAKGLVVIVETSLEWKEYSKKKRVLHICTFRMWLIIDDSGKREPGLNTGFAGTYWPVYILWSAMVTYFILRKVFAWHLECQHCYRVRNKPSAVCWFHVLEGPRWCA